ncbi:MAG: hypothetical protein ACK5GN_13145, partial [Pseudomonadota bacterium]
RICCSLANSKTPLMRSPIRCVEVYLQTDIFTKSECEPALAEMYPGRGGGYLHLRPQAVAPLQRGESAKSYDGSSEKGSACGGRNGKGGKGIPRPKHNSVHTWYW